MAATSEANSQSSFIASLKVQQYLKGTPSDTGELTSYLRMLAKHVYLQGKGESEELLRLPKPLTLVLATRLSTYPLATISRTVQI